LPPESHFRPSTKLPKVQPAVLNQTGPTAVRGACDILSVG